MSYLLGVLAFVLALLLAVALHELGHLVPAKLFGVLVPEYYVGFGPTLWRRRVGETTYGVKAVLLGGYVRILGMYGPARPGARRLRADGRPTLAEAARRASMAEIPAGADARAFYHLSAGRKLAVMGGGLLMNLAQCAVFTAIAIVGIGAPVATTTLAAVPATVATAQGQEPGPAAAAGLRPGDTVLAWGGRETRTFEDVRRAVQAGGTSDAEVVVRRDGRRIAVRVAPVRGEDGAPVAGIQAAIGRERGSGRDVGVSVWTQFTGTAGVVVRLPEAVWDVARSLATGRPRGSSGIVSVVGVGRIAGEVASSDSGATAGGGLADRAAVLLALAASLNMAVFVFNLLPFPPLDGGHVAGALFEGARRGWARLRGRPDPGPADTARLTPLAYAVIGVLVVMTLLLVVADVVDPIRLS